MGCQFDVRMVDVPTGYTRRSGLEYSEHYGRYLWLPKAGDLIYAYAIDKIYKYVKWACILKGCRYPVDGYAWVEDIETGKRYWTLNVEVRKCVPIERSNQ